METLRDPISSVSHFLMAAIAVVVALFLMRLTKGDASRRLPVMIFACSSVLLYTASGLYHAVRLPPDEVLFFQLLDMSAIYLMIAGSATPIAMILLRGRPRAILLYGEWGCAIIGIISLWVLPKPDHAVLVLCYLSMAWFSCAFLGFIWRATGWDGLRWLLTSMSINIAGAVMDVLQWPVVVSGVLQWHELLHFCDMGATACYVVFLVKFVIPYGATAPVAAEEAAGFVAPAQA